MYAFSDAIVTACPEHLREGYIVGTCRPADNDWCMSSPRTFRKVVTTVTFSSYVYQNITGLQMFQHVSVPDSPHDVWSS